MLQDDMHKNKDDKFLSHFILFQKDPFGISSKLLASYLCILAKIPKKMSINVCDIFLCFEIFIR